MESNLVLSGYQKRIIANRHKSDADLIKDDKMLRNTLKEMLGLSFETVVDGEMVDVSLAKLLVSKKISYLMENPKDIDLKELAAVLGENKVEAEITLKSSQDLFGDIVIDYDRTREETE